MYGLSFLLYRQMSPQCTFNTGGLWQRQPRLLVLFRLVLQDFLHSQPLDWLSLTEKHSILRFLIQKFLNRAQVYFMLPTPESLPVMAGNYCVSAPRRRKSRMRNSWDCPFKTPQITTDNGCRPSGNVWHCEQLNLVHMKLSLSKVYWSVTARYCVFCVLLSIQWFFCDLLC